MIPAAESSRREAAKRIEATKRIEAAKRFEASVVDTFRAAFAQYRTAEARATVRVCMAAAYASALRVSYWMAHSQRDYVRSMLGVKHPTFCRWVKVGRLLWASPDSRAALIEGRVTMVELERSAGASGPPQGAASEGSEAVSGFTAISITGPVPAILYMEDSMRLARGMVGATEGDENALGALLAEASTEIDTRVDVQLARRRFRVRDPAGTTGSGSSSEASSSGPLASYASNTNPPATDAPSSEFLAPALRSASVTSTPRLPNRGEAAQRRAAHRVHTILCRLIGRRDRLAIRQADLLDEWYTNDLHHRTGYRNFERFAEDLLGLCAGTCRERLRQARLRRRRNAIAIAARDGRISSLQAELLDRMWRQSHIPSSDLEAWCDYAASHTLRRLRSAARWARRRADHDYRRWSLDHCPPPTNAELRTMDHSLERLVQETRTEELGETLVRWESAPRGTFHLVISRETRDELLVQIASMQETARSLEESPSRSRIPAWLALCRIFQCARESWKQHHQAPPAPLRRILDRDGYQCAVPECSRRRNLQVHHLEYRSRGGDDRDENRVTLCAFHHQQGEHGGLLRVRGEIGEEGEGLTWEMGLDADGRPRRVYRDERLVLAR